MTGPPGGDGHAGQPADDDGRDPQSSFAMTILPGAAPGRTGRFVPRRSRVRPRKRVHPKRRVHPRNRAPKAAPKGAAAAQGSAGPETRHCAPTKRRRPSTSPRLSRPRSPSIPPRRSMWPSPSRSPSPSIVPSPSQSPPVHGRACHAPRRSPWPRPSRSAAPVAVRARRLLRSSPLRRPRRSSTRRPRSSSPLRPPPAVQPDRRPVRPLVHAARPRRACGVGLVRAGRRARTRGARRRLPAADCLPDGTGLPAAAAVRRAVALWLPPADCPPAGRPAAVRRQPEPGMFAPPPPVGSWVPQHAAPGAGISSGGRSTASKVLIGLAIAVLGFVVLGILAAIVIPVVPVAAEAGKPQRRVARDVA